MLTTSRRIAKNLASTLHLDKKRIHCVPTGIDLEKFRPDITSPLRQELGIGGDVKLVGMVSVIRSWKGHEYFIEAAARIVKNRSDVLFLIVGDGPLRHDVEAKIKALRLEKSVLMLGHRENVPRVLAALDVVVLPSYAHEGIPQILLQAMAMKKAVVGTCVVGIPEIVENEKTGLIVEPKNPNALTDAILRMINERDLREKLGGQAHEMILQNHSLETMCGTLEKIYELSKG